MDELEVEFVLANDVGIEAEFILESEGGTDDHNELINRDMEDQHPISAITGLQDELNSKQNKLISGPFIHIDSNNKITTTYTAGDGIEIGTDGKITNTISKSDQISYENWRNPDVSNVKEGLDAALKYTTTELSITGDTVFEIGTQVSTLTFNWNPISTAVTKIEPIIGQVISTPPYTHNFTTPVTEDTTFTLSMYPLDNPDDVITGSTSIKFLPKVYWGSSVSTSVSNQEILEFNSKLSENRFAVGTDSLLVNCESGKYIYIVIPTSYIDDNFRIRIGGLNCSDYEVSTIQLVNEPGYTQDYNIYKINNLQHTQLIDVEIL